MHGKSYGPTDILNILLTGVPTGVLPSDKESQAGLVVEILQDAVICTPDIVLTYIRDACECRLDGMISLALAILSAGADESFFTKDVNNAIQAVLLVYGPMQLLEYVEYMKSKAFGRGLGSKPQKWIRNVMEGWSPGILQKYIKACPKQLRDLLLLIHPRINGVRGQIIKEFLSYETKAS